MTDFGKMLGESLTAIAQAGQSASAAGWRMGRSDLAREVQDILQRAEASGWDAGVTQRAVQAAQAVCADAVTQERADVPN